MASGQEIVERILKGYNVEFDSSVSGKLNEFMVHQTLDILREAKLRSIYANKDHVSLVDIRQAIREGKERKGASFDEIKALAATLQNSSDPLSRGDTNSTRMECLLFPAPDTSYSLSVHASIKRREDLKQQAEEYEEQVKLDKKHPSLLSILNNQAKQQYIQQGALLNNNPNQEQLVFQSADSLQQLQKSSAGAISIPQQKAPAPEDDEDNYE